MSTTQTKTLHDLAEVTNPSGKYFVTENGGGRQPPKLQQLSRKS